MHVEEVTSCTAPVGLGRLGRSGPVDARLLVEKRDGGKEKPSNYYANKKKQH